VDDSIPEDTEDKENLEWCGPIDRTKIQVKVCRSAAIPSRFKPNEIQEQTTVEAVKPLIEIAEIGTQTLPSDFRIANIRYPMLEDFKAIHNDRSGHHGLEYSYRKLLKHCGSKWANERGEAKKIKEQLKQYLDPQNPKTPQRLITQICDF